MTDDNWRISSDNPTIQDELNYKPYANTLTKVILNIRIEQTPLTIGIHGPWGSGKTSLMEMIQKNLGNDVVSLWFIAWEYDKVDTIWTALFQNSINKIQSSLGPLNINSYRQVRELKKAFLSVLLDLSIRNISRGGLSLSDVKSHFKKYNQVTKNIESLSDHFEKAIKGLVGPEGKFVIFIDDLDRCLPERAVEILESLKLFLDAKHCIFVIGVDRDVIWKGIEARYHSDYNEKSPIRGKDYIEKIIQLPFNVPQLKIDEISHFIEKLYEYNFSTKINKTVLKTIASGIEPNPRKIKRFMNLYSFQLNVKSEMELQEIDDKLLAKFLIIQLRWDDFYKNLINYYNLTGGENLINKLLSFEELSISDDEMAKMRFKSENPLIDLRFLDIDYFGLRNFLKTEPTFKADLGPYIYLSQTTIIKEIESQDLLQDLKSAIESKDENDRLNAIKEIDINFDKIPNPGDLLEKLVQDKSSTVKSHVVKIVFENWDKFKRYTQLINFITYDKSSFDNLPNLQDLIPEFISDDSWAIRSRAVWLVFENYDKLKNPQKLLSILSNDSDDHVQRALEWAHERYPVRYLFSWNKIPGNDDERFIEFLKQNFSIDWVKTAKIEKIDDDKTIKVSTEMNSLSLRLNNEKTKVNLQIDDDRTDEFIVKTENGKLNIYK